MKENIFLKGVRPYLWIFIIGFIIYSQTLFFDFTYLDDNVLILDNFYFLSNLTNVFRTFTQDVFQTLHYSDAYYRPLLIISFILDAQLGKNSPFIYHFTNIVLHFSASCLLFLFLKKLKYKKELAFISALIFTVHPVLTQAIAWIPGRNDCLLAIFIFSSFIFFLNSIKTKKQRCSFWHLFFFGLALFTKETAIVLVPIFFLYLRLINKERLASFNKKILTLNWGVMICFWFLLRKIALKNPLRMTITDVAKSILSNFPAAIQLLGKMVFPFNLSVFPIIKDTTFIYGFVALILLVIALLISINKRLNFVLFGLSWLILFLFPPLFLHSPALAFGDDYHLEHRVYLPLVGLIILLLEIDWIKNLNFKKGINLILIGSIIFAFSILTVKHSKSFKNRLNFWQSAVAASPHSPFARRNLGAMYYLDDRLDKAEGEYKKALELNPDEQMAHNNLGLIYMNRGSFQEAEKEYKKELEINPSYDTVHFNLGLLYRQQGEMEKAIEWWQKTIAVNPEYFQAHVNLAIYYYQQQEFNKAIYHCNEVLKRGGSVPRELWRGLFYRK